MLLKRQSSNWEPTGSGSSFASPSIRFHIQGPATNPLTNHLDLSDFGHSSATIQNLPLSGLSLFLLRPSTSTSAYPILQEAEHAPVAAPTAHRFASQVCPIERTHNLQYHRYKSRAARSLRTSSCIILQELESSLI